MKKYKVTIITSNPDESLSMTVNQHVWVYWYDTYADARAKMEDELSKNNNLKGLYLNKVG